MSNQLTTMIRRLENELTAIKTAHLHGLGTVQFYQAMNSGRFNYHPAPLDVLPDRVKCFVKVTAVIDEPASTFFQTAFRMSNSAGEDYIGTIEDFSYSGSTYIWTIGNYHNTSVDTLDCAFQIISTRNIKSLTLEDATDE